MAILFLKVVVINSLDDSDLVGDVQGVEVGCQPYVGLLLTVGSERIENRTKS